MFLTKIDLYIIRRFLGTLFFILLMLSAVIVVFDISQKVDDFIANHASAYVIIFTYNFNFLPWLLNTLLPMFIFVTVIFSSCTEEVKETPTKSRNKKA